MLHYSAIGEHLELSNLNPKALLPVALENAPHDRHKVGWLNRPCSRLYAQET